MTLASAFPFSIIATLLFGALSGAAAQTPPDIVMTNAASRDGRDLSGSWAYSIDPYRDGLYGFHGDDAGPGHQRFDPVDVDTATRKDPLMLYEYDMRRSPRATLPSSWSSHEPALRHYQGLVWYERAFTAHKSKSERAFIKLGAANYTARVYLNGELVGTHEGGFTPFTFEVTDLLKNGENSITIGVDSVRVEDSVPSPVTDWETYGGVTRPVRLIVTPATFIDDAWLRLTRDGKIAASIKLNGENAAQQPVHIEISGAGVDLSGTTDSAGRLEVSVPAPTNLKLWSPDSPTLYDVAITSGADTLHERIGFRTIEVRGEDILLNGAPIFLRGICMHEEELGVDPARVMTKAAARALFTEIKQGLHGNFVRLAHYPHSEAETRLADEMGLLLWSEIPVYWRIDWDNPKTLKTARRMLAENIARDRNRASIILWSVGNETPVSDARETFLETLVDDVRALDDTRLVTAALLTHQIKEKGALITMVEDPLVDHLDVMSVNAYYGWYGPIPLRDVSDIVWRSDHGKPMIFSELGAGALAGFHDPGLMRKFSEEYQAEYYRETLEMADKIPFLKGMSPWILKDFRSPRRQHPIYQQGWNRKGLISETGQRKEAFGVLSDYYEGKAEAGGD